MRKAERRRLGELKQKVNREESIRSGLAAQARDRKERAEKAEKAKREALRLERRNASIVNAEKIRKAGQQDG